MTHATLRAPGTPRDSRIVLGLCLLVTTLAAVVGSLGSRDAPGVYPTFAKPAWAPPGWVFGPVWTLLYLAMAIAAWMVVREVGWPRARVAFGLFVAQLAANALWSWFFFAWRDGRGAFIEVLVLWLAVAATLSAFFRLRRAAGWLLVPYLAWVTFAAWLTWVVWRLNPTML